MKSMLARIVIRHVLLAQGLKLHNVWNVMKTIHLDYWRLWNALHARIHLFKMETLAYTLVILVS